MRSVLKTAPAIEPVTLAEVRVQCRIDPATCPESVETVQSIAPGEYNNETMTGAGVDIQGHIALVILGTGDIGSGGTVDVTVQESDDNATFANWVGGTFIQITDADQNVIRNIQYTGTKRYLRAVAVVNPKKCTFRVSVMLLTADGICVAGLEDDYLTSLIRTARLRVEDYLGRALIKQTWYFYFDDFPCGSRMILGMGTLESITAAAFAYTNSGGTATTVSATVYEVDTAVVPGEIVLKYGQSWPAAELKTVNPIVVEAVVGYGDERTDVPENVRQAILILCADMYERREDITDRPTSSIGWLDALLAPERIWRL